MRQRLATGDLVNFGGDQVSASMIRDLLVHADECAGYASPSSGTCFDVAG